MPEAIIGPIAGSVVGGLMSDGGGEQQTATKEPWSAAAPWLRQQLEQGHNLQAYYQQNPWNNLQQTAYQNTFSDIDNFRSSMAPGLMDFANRLMGQNYSRSGGGGGGGFGGQTKPMQMLGGASAGSSAPATQQDGGAYLSALLNAMGQIGQSAPQQQSGLLGLSTQGPFSAQRGQAYGLLDFKALNPYNNALKPAEIKQPTQQTIEEAIQAELDRRAAAQVDPYYAANGGA